MVPSQQFQNMIAMLFQSRQNAVSNLDLIKHRDNKTAFYPITEMRCRNTSIISQTQPFSNSKIIEIEKGGDNVYIISENSTTQYKRTS